MLFLFHRTFARRLLLYAAMPAWVNTPAALIALLLLFASASANADSDDVGSPLDRRWLPSFGPTAGVTLQKMGADVASRCARGGPEVRETTFPFRLLSRECESFPTPLQGGALRPADSGSEMAVSPYVGGVLQVMSPTLDLFPGRPRVFATGEAMALFAPDRDIATEGNPSQVGYPTGLNPDNRALAATPALTGRGSKTTASVQTLGLSASLGLAFPFDIFGRRLWLKPSAGWYRYKVDVEGVVVGGFKKRCPTSIAQPECGPFRPERNFREIQLGASDTLTLNGVGPGIEFELETGRFGPIGSSLYLGGYAYRVLGNRSVQLSDSVLYVPTPAPDTPVLDAVGSEGFAITSEPDIYGATWSYEARPWIYRTGIGFRFHWVGFQK
jgi:hypothetical protein